MQRQLQHPLGYSNTPTGQQMQGQPFRSSQQNKTGASNHTQTRRRCYRCGLPGHIKRDCQAVLNKEAPFLHNHQLPNNGSTGHNHSSHFNGQALQSASQFLTDQTPVHNQHTSLHARAQHDPHGQQFVRGFAYPNQFLARRSLSWPKYGDSVSIIGRYQSEMKEQEKHLSYRWRIISGQCVILFQLFYPEKGSTEGCYLPAPYLPKPEHFISAYCGFDFEKTITNYQEDLDSFGEYLEAFQVYVEQHKSEIPNANNIEIEIEAILGSVSKRHCDGTAVRGRDGYIKRGTDGSMTRDSENIWSMHQTYGRLYQMANELKARLEQWAEIHSQIRHQSAQNTRKLNKTEVKGMNSRRVPSPASKFVGLRKKSRLQLDYDVARELSMSQKFLGIVIKVGPNKLLHTGDASLSELSFYGRRMRKGVADRTKDSDNTVSKVSTNQNQQLSPETDVFDHAHAKGLNSSVRKRSALDASLESGSDLKSKKIRVASDAFSTAPKSSAMDGSNLLVPPANDASFSEPSTKKPAKNEVTHDKADIIKETEKGSLKRKRKAEAGSADGEDGVDVKKARFMSEASSKDLSAPYISSVSATSGFIPEKSTFDEKAEVKRFIVASPTKAILSEKSIKDLGITSEITDTSGESEQTRGGNDTKNNQGHSPPDDSIQDEGGSALKPPSTAGHTLSEKVGNESPRYKATTNPEFTGMNNTTSAAILSTTASSEEYLNNRIKDNADEEN